MPPLPVIKVMLEPQSPHLAKPVNSVLVVTTLGGTTSKERDCLRALVASKMALSIIGSTGTGTHSDSGFSNLVLLFFLLK
nr:hypothetical protein [Polynucleobacter sp. UB-Tiil-W10]